MAVVLGGNPLTSLIRDLDVRPDLQPAGNHVAFNLGQVYNDSRGLFPESVYNQPVARKNRWRSLYGRDFVSQHDNPAFEPAILARPRNMLDVFDEETPKTFNQWKIPERVTDRFWAERRASKAKADTAQDDAHRQKTELPNIRSGAYTSRSSSSKSAGSLSARSPSRARPLGKTLHTSARARLAPHKDLRNASLQQFVEETGSNASSEKPTYEMKRLPKSYLAQQLLQNFNCGPPDQNMPMQTAVEWLQNASSSERRTIEQALAAMSSQEKHTELGRAVQDWLSNASVTDRNVAADFFKSLAATKLLGNETSDTQKRIMSIAQILRGDTPKSGTHRQRHAESGNAERRHALRLLTPGTRANKWMEQTWHHLPTHYETRVDNRSSFYTQPHKSLGHDFVIHPDWG